MFTHRFKIRADLPLLRFNKAAQVSIGISIRSIQVIDLMQMSQYR